MKKIFIIILIFTRCAPVIAMQESSAEQISFSAKKKLVLSACLQLPEGGYVSSSFNASTRSLQIVKCEIKENRVRTEKKVFADIRDIGVLKKFENFDSCQFCLVGNSIFAVLLGSTVSGKRNLIRFIKDPMNNRFSAHVWFREISKIIRVKCAQDVRTKDLIFTLYSRAPHSNMEAKHRVILNADSFDVKETIDIKAFSRQPVRFV